jgi:gliding motility-associated-like protein
MKKICCIFLFVIASNIVYANHIIGGEMYYTYVGKGISATSHVYQITLKLYRGNSGAALDQFIPITIFRSLTGAAITGPVYAKKYATLEGPFQVNYFSTNPCIFPPEDVNYQYGLYTVTVDLQESSYGYIVAYQRCCRDADIKNLKDPGEQGATYFTKIPGRLNTDPISVINSSPKFSDNDSALVCRFSKFKLDFSAVDADSDILTYQFTSAYKGGGTQKDGIKCNEYRPDPACMPFEECLYQPGFSMSSPMGPNVTINPVTGIVSGVAPAAGEYVVAVLCYEKRGDVIIGFHYKEFLVRVSAECSALTAQLNPRPVNCDSFTVSFQNDAANNGLNVDYFWDFGEQLSPDNTSLLPAPLHTYSNAGDYKVKLKVSIAGNCVDSAETIVKVYPGFVPDFEILGECKNIPIQFNDKTQAAYGNVTGWEWGFADFASATGNSSTLQNPTHTYSFPLDYTVSLKVSTTKGCTGIVSKLITIRDSPLFSAFPKDTLICIADTLQIGVTGQGTALWSPNYMINDVTWKTPFVSPDVITVYKINFTDAFGCSATDSIKINVTDRVYQGSNYDTVICEKDPVILRLNSNALYYSWTPDNGSLNNTSIKNPTATVTGNTSTLYNVVGKISNKCFAQNSIKVTPVPYPVPVAPDVSVCAGESAQLQASGGSIYSWSPRVFLNNTAIPNPVALKPTGSVTYTLTVKDLLGCPKPVQKTVRLNVIKVIANAGPRDTSIVLGQPLQLTASGGINYLWLPDNRWLNNIAVSNPVALPENNIEYIVQASNNGCIGLDSIRVKLYRVAADLYIPTAFTPNADGYNDDFKPILLGIKSLDLFQVYNRFGQLIYNSTDITKGWNGTLGGRPQEPGSYLWVARATDYTGKKILRKGSVILIK